MDQNHFFRHLMFRPTYGNPCLNNTPMVSAGSSTPMQTNIILAPPTKFQRVVKSLQNNLPGKRHASSGEK